MLNAISSQIGIHEWGFAGSTWKQFDFGISSDKLKISNSLSKGIDGKEMYQLYEKGEFVQIYFPSDRKLEISKSRTVEAVDISAVKMPTEKVNYLKIDNCVSVYLWKRCDSRLNYQIEKRLAWMKWQAVMKLFFIFF